MPSLLEDPTTYIPPPAIAETISQTLTPMTKTLKDSTKVSLYPIAHGAASIPSSLVKVLHREFSEEIARGATYPMEEAMGLDQFAGYWFGTFAVVAVVDRDHHADGPPGRWLQGQEDRDWERDCLGTFYVKPNYPGRCSHVCNAGFLTTAAARGRGVGIGYKYSVFNLVFENNVASVKIWERLGFKIIGRVPGAARLANSPDLVDALIIGKELV
ncbi:GNAT family N-acetyltransferase [Aspergillus affinis]|uniref:GNAT family N-acetyltransferase n=1 Tax=Aspergillus affinis TaxID=1070780 RepID=UPI0022FF1F37|nr:putative acetyltransferase [Aspergillus affinis]KAI9042473.1 putative acetyltransferase [Aspergillus affinis]